MAELSGACHCGAIKVRFTAADPGGLETRACQCSFCRRHGARTVSDPKGKVVIVAEPDALHRYRFNTASADFLICSRCGSYAGAMIGDGRNGFATINVTALALSDIVTREAKPVHFDDESVETRLRRRRAVWTPAEIVDQPTSNAAA